MQEEGEGAGWQVNVEQAEDHFHAPAHLLTVHLASYRRCVSVVLLLHYVRLCNGCITKQCLHLEVAFVNILVNNFVS